MANNSFLLKKGKFTQKKFNKMLVSSILAWLVVLVDECADTFVAGAYIGEDAVSGISLIAPFLSILSFISYLISMGTSLMYSKEAGAFNKEKAYKIVGQGFILSVVASALLAISMLLLKGPVLRFYNPTPIVAQYAEEYFTCQIFFAITYPVYFLLCQLVNIDGDEIIGFLACALAAASNLISSLILVNSMGVKGLAIGSAISCVVGILTYCIHFLRKTNSIKVKPYFNFKDFGEMIKLSSTTSLTLLYVAIIDIVMNKFVISRFSDNYLPAYAIINLVLNIGAVFSSCYDSAAGFITIGFGEKNPNSIKQTMKIATKASIIEAVLMFVTMEVFAESLPAVYGITSPDALEASIIASRIIAFSNIGTALVFLFQAYYTATGHIFEGNFLSNMYMFFTPLAVALPLGYFFGWKGLCVGFMLTPILAVIFAAILICLRYGKKSFPLILEETDEDYLSYNLVLNDGNISSLCEQVCRDLNEKSISSIVSNEVQLVLEESYMTIINRNKKGKKILTECTILCNDNHLRLIIRDNGKIFDITEVDGKVSDFRSYVLARLMEKNTGRAHVTTISFNRNSFYWDFANTEA